MRRVVLNLHGLGEPHDGVEADERPYWLSFEAFDALLSRIAASGEIGRYEWTFDDGNASDLVAARRLAELGIAARFFVLAGRLDQLHYLRRNDLAELRELGMTVGLHGRSHIDWRSCSRAQLIDETIAARAEIASAVGTPVEEVAIPFGAYDRRVLGWLRQCGFTRIHTSDGGALSDPAAPIWNRTSLRSDMAQAELEALLAGRWSPVQRLRQTLGTLHRRHIA
ncbi:polysaccharide deacetylase family protein [Altererythrobacter sp. BO-6]|uniref:polysaccharide deacetylase family protein n=1 Tax=Altererythrobacter sp. BO-6 TaxID=2604537 RepID=UPI0013E0EF83|nr:polysaccharide deacetylase family protein [Altererythrobacter sp. BO-6]QIG54014.1 polysaccharide deacetylase family protein [Altererythrobacter sp. BO-6]